MGSANQGLYLRRDVTAQPEPTPLQLRRTMSSVRGEAMSCKVLTSYLLTTPLESGSTRRHAWRSDR